MSTLEERVAQSIQPLPETRDAYYAGIEEGLLRFLGACSDLPYEIRLRLIDIHTRLRLKVRLEAERTEG